DGKLQGFNLAPGGSMGATSGDPSTYPALGDLIGFVTPDQILDICWHSIKLQGEYGDRSDRKQARLKYPIDRRSLQWYRDELQSRVSFPIQPPRPYHFDQNGDRYGWVQGENGKWHLTLSILSGRLLDDDKQAMRSGMREIARVHKGEFRLTCDQNVIIASVAPEDRAAIDELVARYQLDDYKSMSGIRKHAIACVALPTCGLAMAESERYAPVLLPKLEELLARHGLTNDPILLRISGCPNGCSRPYLGEIALVGRAPGRYDLRLAADFTGQRINTLHRENITEPEILATLDELFAAYAGKRLDGEYFGDFLVRTGVVPAPEQRLIPIVLETA
ncbi:MAG: sulfite reductase, partial [Castellaniella sp.]